MILIYQSILTRFLRYNIVKMTSLVYIFDKKELIMRITQESDYALRVVLYFSNLNPGTKVSANIVAEDQNIPLRFLLKLLQKLKKADIVESFMGVNGGYALKKEPKDISLKDVIEAIEGPIHLNRCLLDPEQCNNEGPKKCLIHNALYSVQETLINRLASINFKDIADGYYLDRG